MTDVFTNFLTIADMKKTLNILDTDNVNESKLDEKRIDANTEVDKVLLPYADEVPVPVGTPLFSKGQKMAKYYARYLWFSDLHQTEIAKKDAEIYEQMKESIIEVLKANRTTRTKRVSVGTNYRTRRLFSQIQRY